MAEFPPDMYHFTVSARWQWTGTVATGAHLKTEPSERGQR